MIIECRELYKEFISSQASVQALKDVNFSVDEQTFVGIVGPSGCGKTTLLKLIANLLGPTSGLIIIERDQDNGRPGNAMVFQEHRLLPWLTVLDNVALGLEIQGIGKRERHKQASAFIEQVGLSGFSGSYPHQLSLGMCQRASIARAFAANPRILLMDEPFSAVDAQTRLLLQEELLRIWREHKKTIVFVTHDIEEAILLSDRVLVMSGRPGTILEDIQIPLGRPRTLPSKESAKIREIKWHIWKMLETEIRQSLRVSE